MTDVNETAPGGAAEDDAFPSIVGGLIAEAEAASARIAALRTELEAAELRRRKLLVAIHAAAEALPPGLRREHEPRLAKLAEAVAPPRGRRPDSRLAAVIEHLAWLSNHDEQVVKVAELQAHLERLGYRPLPPGYASNALAGLAERGLVSRHSHGRWRIHDLHPEIGAMRLKLTQARFAEGRQWVREIDAAERRGRRKAMRGR